MTEFMPVAMLALGTILALNTAGWITSLVISDAGIADVFWGMLFLASALTSAFLATDLGVKAGLILALVAVWSSRLSIHIFVRNSGKPEDSRYQKWRRDAGPAFWWVSFFKVFLLQGLIAWAVSFPLLYAISRSGSASLGMMDIAALVVWTVGFLFESIGDLQLTRFKADPANKGKVLSTGLWSWTRHPNYFGDAVVWWGFFLFAIALPWGWATIFSPILMTWLLVQVSGVKLLESDLADRKPEYREYVRNTSSFIPWFPARKPAAGALGHGEAGATD